jgi:hypothetical protein
MLGEMEAFGLHTKEYDETIAVNFPKDRQKWFANLWQEGAEITN